jgi:hypothetical protein
LDLMTRRLSVLRANRAPGAEIDATAAEVRRLELRLVELTTETAPAAEPEPEAPAAKQGRVPGLELW